MGLVSNTISIEVGSDPHLLAITVQWGGGGGGGGGRDIVGILVGKYTVRTPCSGHVDEHDSVCCPNSHVCSCTPEIGNHKLGHLHIVLGK